MLNGCRLNFPLRWGGSAEDHAPVAYACSLLSSQPMVHSLLGKGGDAQDLASSVPQPVLNRISARSGTQNLAHSRKGKKTAGKDFRNFRESA